MNEAQILERLAAEDTFRADTQLPSTAWSNEIAFTEVERLIDTVPDSTPLRPALVRRRVALLAAAGAFVVVLLIGVTLALFARSGDEPPPVATTPVATTAAPAPTTAAPTTAAPEGEPIDLETQQLLGSLERLYNRGDGDAVGQLLAPDAEVALAPGVDAADSRSAGSLQQRATTGALYGERVRFGDCLGFGTAIRCEVAFADRFSDLIDLEPWPQTWTIEVSEGRITRLEVSGDDPTRAAVMADFQAFVDERAGADAAQLLVGPLEWNRTGEGHGVFDEYVVFYTTLANGVPEETFALISEFHSALSRGDVQSAFASFVPGGLYNSTEAADETSAGVYKGEVVGSPELTEYFDFWYRMMQTDWVPTGCRGDATTVTCNTESRGLLTLFLPGGVAQGVVTYTFGPGGIETVVDRTIRAAGSCGPGGCGGTDGLGLRGFWRSWMPENAPEVELLWPGGNGDAVNGLDDQFAAAVWEYYPQFLMENGIDVPPEYLER